jgi:hypothetical protein
MDINENESLANDIPDRSSGARALSFLLGGVGVLLALVGLLPWFSILTVSFNAYRNGGGSGSPWVASVPPGWGLALVGVLCIGVSIAALKSANVEVFRKWRPAVVSGAGFAIVLTISASLNLHRIADQALASSGSPTASDGLFGADFEKALSTIAASIARIHEEPGFWIAIILSLCIAGIGLWMFFGSEFRVSNNTPVRIPGEEETSETAVPILAPTRRSVWKSPAVGVALVFALATIAVIGVLIKDEISGQADKGSSGAQAQSTSSTTTLTTIDPMATARSNYNSLFTGTAADFTRRDSYKDSSNRIPWSVYPQYCDAILALSTKILANAASITWPPQVASEANAYLKAVNRDATVARNCASLPGTASAQMGSDSSFASNDTGLMQSDFKFVLGIK